MPAKVAREVDREDLPPPVGNGADARRPSRPDPVDQIVRLAGRNDRIAGLEQETWDLP
jgi:hypothetical protein